MILTATCFIMSCKTSKSSGKDSIKSNTENIEMKNDSKQAEITYYTSSHNDMAQQVIRDEKTGEERFEPLPTRYSDTTTVVVKKGYEFNGFKVKSITDNFITLESFMTYSGPGCKNSNILRVSRDGSTETYYMTGVTDETNAFYISAK